MAKFQILVEGYDPTSEVEAITREQLLAMVHEAEHVDYVGAVLHQIAAPDVSTFPKHKYVIWHKLNENLSGTGELYWWSPSEFDWMPLQLAPGSINGAMIADGTITLAKLDATGLTPLAIIRVNSTGTGFEAVLPDVIVPINSVAYDKLLNAAGPGYMLFSATGGVWTAIFWSDKFAEELGISEIPVANLIDGDDVGLLDQVLRRTADSHYDHEYADQLLRPNHVPTNSLLFAPGSAGKNIKVNATNSDFDYEDISAVTVRAATLRYTVASGTSGQGPIVGGVETAVIWNNVVDPTNLVGIASPGTAFTLATGTYVIDVTVPCFASGGGGDQYALVMYDLTGTSLIATSTCFITSSDEAFINLKHIVTVAASTNIYEVRFFCDTNVVLGSAANIPAYPESFQQMSILKIA